jgi:hypothetical protein
MALTRTQWNTLQAKLPVEDRESYETYLAAQAPAPAATPATPATPAAAATAVAQAVNPIAAAVPTAGVVNTVKVPPAAERAAAAQEFNPVAASIPVAGVYSGPTGPVSATGITGATGVTGATNVTGATGAASGLITGFTPDPRLPTSTILPGASGFVGPVGITGATGPINGATGITGASGVVTLAKDTFASTLALLMGDSEVNQPWVDELRGIIQGFINTGSDVATATNLALREAKSKGKASKFVQRFDAIFKLQDRLNAGETVQVPSIADYVKSEQELGDVLRSVGLGDLATQEFAKKVFGDANKSVSEASLLISDVFNAIDNAPRALKQDLETLAPGIDRTSIARALLLGKEGAAALTKKISTISQVSAAKSQGVTIDAGTAADLAAGGETYGTSLGKFGTVKNLERGQQLGKMSNIKFTQEDAIASTFQSSADANEKIRKIKEEEANRFSGRSGVLKSQKRNTAGLI